MAKRLSDTNKWDDPWFLDLSSEYRQVWLFILDKCNLAGIWKVNKRMIDFVVGSTVNLGHFLASSGDRVREYQNGEKWFIKGFLNFQYGPLQVTNRVHNAVINELQKEGLWIDYPYSFQGDKEKDKDKAKDKEKAKEKGRGAGEGFSVFWENYPNKIGKGAAEKSWSKLNPSQDLVDKIIQAVTVQKRSVQWNRNGGQYIPGPAVWLNQKRWEDDLEIQTGPDLSRYKNAIISTNPSIPEWEDENDKTRMG